MAAAGKAVEAETCHDRGCDGLKTAGKCSAERGRLCVRKAYFCNVGPGCRACVVGLKVGTLVCMELFRI